MCIVCDIKQAVEASGPNKEDRAKILGLVEKLAALGRGVCAPCCDRHKLP